jgi:alpha-L-fucosidase
LLLNVPPTRDGRIHEVDAARLAEFRSRLDATFASDLAAGARSTWRVTGERRAELEVNLERPAAIGLVRLAENIRDGQRVTGYTVHGDSESRELARGTTIGHAKIDRLPSTRVSRVRLLIETVDAPQRVELRLYG